MYLFDKFFACTFGENIADFVYTDMKQEYHEEIARRISQVSTDFQNFWNIWQPQLVDHYKATFKCVPKSSVRLLGENSSGTCVQHQPIWMILCWTKDGLL